MRIMIVLFIVMVCEPIFSETNTVSPLVGLVLKADDIRHVNGSVLFQHTWPWDKTFMKDGKKVSPSNYGITQEIKYGSSTFWLCYCMFENKNVAYLSAKEYVEGLSIRVYPGIWTNSYGLKMIGDLSWYTFLPQLKQSGLIFHYNNLYIMMGNSSGTEEKEAQQGILAVSEAIIKKYDMGTRKGTKIKEPNYSNSALSLSGVVLTTNDFQKLDMSIITQRESSFSRARSLHSVYGIGQTVNCRSGEFRLHYGLFENKEDAYLSAKDFPLIIIGPGIWTNSPSLKKVGDCAWYVFHGTTHIVLFQRDKLCVTIEAPGERASETKMQGTLALAETIIRKYDVIMRRNDDEKKSIKTVQ
jgi:hypothetical protein